MILSNGLTKIIPVSPLNQSYIIDSVMFTGIYYFFYIENYDLYLKKKSNIFIH